MADAYHLETSLWLPTPRDRVFPFFADANNLERITPPFLRFRLTANAPIAMRPGALIRYRLRLHGVPIRWTTEITGWDPPHRFVDTQVSGPYAEWVHTHTFREQDGGTLVEDHVRYRLPGPDFVGRLANRFLVERDTRQIFEYRHAVLCDLFEARETARVGPVSVRREVA